MCMDHKDNLVIIYLLIVFAACKAVIIEPHGLQPDNMTALNDNSIDTCTTFVADKLTYTQLFKQVICTSNHTVINLVGQDMKCESNIYVVGLKGADVGKSLNSWKSCKPIFQTRNQESVDWCSYDCLYTGGFEQMMVLRWPKSLLDAFWTLCDITVHCTGLCKNQTICYIYGEGSWDEGSQFCQQLHPKGHMITETSDEQRQGHQAEADAAGYKHYWIGARRPPGGGEYEFYFSPSGAGVNYTKWDPSQPHRGSDDDDCILASRYHNWDWYDYSCSKIFMYMCSIEDL